MKIFIKTLLITLLISICFINYKIISINGKLKIGMVELKTSMAIFTDFEDVYGKVESFTYYKNPFNNNYLAIIETREKIYTYEAIVNKEFDEINTLEKYLEIKAEPISIVPVKVYILLLIIILIFPSPKWFFQNPKLLSMLGIKKQKTKADEMQIQIEILKKEIEKLQNFTSKN